MYTSNLFSGNNDMVDWLKFYTISNLRVSLIEFHKRVVFFFCFRKTKFSLKQSVVTWAERCMRSREPTKRNDTGSQSQSDS